jgi:hypothetical protein
MYGPETKLQSADWSSSKKPKAQKVRMQKSRLKTMMTAFLDAKVIILKEFVPGKETGNGKCYQEIVRSSSSR